MIVGQVVKRGSRYPEYSYALSQADRSFQYAELLAAIVRSGLEDEGPEYLRTQGGQFWCWTGGIEPKKVWERAINLGNQRLQHPLAKAVLKR